MNAGPPWPTGGMERGAFDHGLFDYKGSEMAYEVHGEGDRVLLYMHGLLMDRQMNRALARTLANRGHRVVIPDFLGHGESDKPTRASRYRMDAFGREMVALLDHLEIDRAVIGGVSLGAGVSLQMAVNAPDRMQALVLEMPVLEWAVPAAAMLFVPLLLAMHYASGPMGALAGLARRVPLTGHDSLDSLVGAAGNEPEVVKAILHGVLTGPVAPTVEERAAIDVPALVIAHGRDLIHPFSDAEALAELLPQGRLEPARSMLELRARPQRLTESIADFLDDAWSTTGAVPLSS